MKRFNLAWTFWEENPNALWGMAIVVFEQTMASDAETPDTALKGFDQSVALATEALSYEPKNIPLLSDLALLHATRGAFRKHGGKEGVEEDFAAAETALKNAEIVEGKHPKFESTWETLERYRGNAAKADAHAAKSIELSEAFQAKLEAQAAAEESAAKQAAEQAAEIKAKETEAPEGDTPPSP